MPYKKCLSVKDKKKTTLLIYCSLSFTKSSEPELIVYLDSYSPGVFWDSRFFATPTLQSVSTTGGCRGRSRPCYAMCHMPGEGSIEWGNKRLPESPNALKTQQKCGKTEWKSWEKKFLFNLQLCLRKSWGNLIKILLFYLGCVKKQLTDS